MAAQLSYLSERVVASPAFQPRVSMVRYDKTLDRQIPATGDLPTCGTIELVVVDNAGAVAYYLKSGDTHDGPRTATSWRCRTLRSNRFKTAIVDRAVSTRLVVFFGDAKGGPGSPLRL